MDTRSQLTTGHRVGLVAAMLVIACFFFPWIELNLILASANLSGFQLATGSGPAGVSFPGIPTLLLVPLSMIGVLFLLAACYAGSGQLPGRAAGSLLIAAGGLSTLIILYQYLTLNQQLNQDVLGMITQRMFSYSFGAHASLLGSAGVAGGGLLDFLASKNEWLG